MKNTFNPEYTRQALQSKYGDPNSFVYEPVQAIYLNWTVSDLTSPDYVFISSALNTFSFLVGTLSMLVDLGNVGGYRMQINTPTIQAQTTINIVTAAFTNPISVVKQFSYDCILQNLVIVNVVNNPIAQFEFQGFYYIQP